MPNLFQRRENFRTENPVVYIVLYTEDEKTGDIKYLQEFQKIHKNKLSGLKITNEQRDLAPYFRRSACNFVSKKLEDLSNNSDYQPDSIYLLSDLDDHFGKRNEKNSFEMINICIKSEKDEIKKLADDKNMKIYFLISVPCFESFYACFSDNNNELRHKWCPQGSKPFKRDYQYNKSFLDIDKAKGACEVSKERFEKYGHCVSNVWAEFHILLLYLISVVESE